MKQIIKSMLVGLLAFTLSWFAAGRADVVKPGAEAGFWFFLALVSFSCGLAATIATLDLLAPRKRPRL